MSFRRTRAMARKELLHIVRDPLSLGMALAVPLMMLLLFGYALSLDVDRIKTLVRDDSRTPLSADLISRFEGSRFFQIIREPDVAIQDAIDRGDVLLGLEIPFDFAERLERGETATVQLIVDGSDSNTASIALGYGRTVVNAFSLERRLRAVEQRGAGRPAAALDARIRVWYNPELKSRNYIVPGLIAVILMIIAALLTSLTISREYELGTLELLLSTPLRPAEIVLGKMTAYFLLGAVDALVCVLVGVGIFGVPLRGSILQLAVVTAVFMFGSLCWGLLISAAARSQMLAYQIGILSSFLPAFLLSGFVYSIENMPVVVQAITHIVPARYFVALLKGIFLKGVSVWDLWPDVLFLVAYAVLVFVGATRQLTRKLA
ncbi:MAG: ABC transporter permease subunit [Acidobacteria bacterium]|nr:ABC transporter permease subunit [Acidobacteriota bacterium]